MADLLWNAGFDDIRFSEQRYDIFSDAPVASSAAAFGTVGVNIWAVKPSGPRRGQAPNANREPQPVEPESTTLDSLPETDEVYDAGDLGCGDGPLIQIAATLKQMPPGGVLEVRSTDPGVASDLPAWCRMVGHSYLGAEQNRYFVQRKGD